MRRKLLVIQIVVCFVLCSRFSFALDSLTLLATLVGQSDDELYHCASAGDVNGDGFKDIIVGAPQMLMDRGYAYIYFGGAEFDTIPDVRLIGEPFDSGLYVGFGENVASAGDVNLDGYGDVLVVAGFVREVFLYFGGVEMDSIEDVVFQGGSGDLYSFGASVSCAGDLNSDDYDDIIISSPEYPAGMGTGRVYIYFGGENMNNQADICIQGGEGDCLGSSVAGLGDVNQDGYDDILVGAPTDGPTQFEGRASIYFGGDPMDTVADVTFWGDSATFRSVGYWIAGADDVNGDSIPDVMISASSKVKLFFGGAQMDTIADLILTGEEPLSQPFSYGIAPAGDLNKDGSADIMVSHSSFGDSGEGKVYIFYGGPDMDTSFDVALIGDHHPWTQFGTRVSPAGDISGDGYDEVLICSHGDSTNRGKLFMYTSYPTWVSEHQEEEVTRYFCLSQNYPNPFNSGTAIRFSIGSSRLQGCPQVTLRIYNIRGQLVRTLLDEEKEPGAYQIVWDGKDNWGKEAVSGIYFCQLMAKGFTETKKMLLLK